MEKTPRPGRPTLDDDGDRSIQVAIRVPPKHFDKLCHRAAREGVSMAHLVRQQLRPITDPDD